MGRSRWRSLRYSIW